MKVNKPQEDRQYQTTGEEKTINQIDCSIVLPAHTQIFKQQKQVSGRSDHIPINVNTECQ
jgi:hypothetical protein